MINEKKANDKLAIIANKHKYSFMNWLNKKFKFLKFASATEKGDIGEIFLSELLQDCGYSDVHTPKGRRGQYDVSVKKSNKEIRFECKVATLDVKKSFQFNGIRYDTDYTHLFCLGISPDIAKFLIVEKSTLGRPPHKMVSMAKNSNASFKLTKPEGVLLSFDQFQQEVDNLWI